MTARTIKVKPKGQIRIQIDFDTEEPKIKQSFFTIRIELPPSSSYQIALIINLEMIELSYRFQVQHPTPAIVKSNIESNYKIPKVFFLLYAKL